MPTIAPSKKFVLNNTTLNIHDETNTPVIAVLVPGKSNEHINLILAAPKLLFAAKMTLADIGTGHKSAATLKAAIDIAEQG